jgi:hypothetical protein
MNSYGFIITRHVNSEKTNKYWNYCVTCIRKFYPFKKIIIIDDNSNPAHVKAYDEYTNIEIVKSEFPGRGELLPFYYFNKNNYFENAVILHDSVFFKKRINFEIFLNKTGVLPLWHFEYKTEDTDNCIRLCSQLNNVDEIREKVSNSAVSTFGIRKTDKWSGCFGIQCFINRAFLLYITNKYNIFELLKTVQTRRDRCSLERVIGAIFFTENPLLYKTKSILGNILHPQHNWGLTFENFMKNQEKINLPLVKVWSGR